jgi:transposase-like protein
MTCFTAKENVMERPDLAILACVNPACQLFGHSGHGNLVVRKIDGSAALRRLRCRSCGAVFSARLGTALFTTKVSEAPAVEVLDHLAEGCRVRSTARLVKGCKETGARLWRVAGHHAERMHDQPVQSLPPRALACDEQWSVVKKKHKRGMAHERGAAGDRWEQTAVAADSTLVVALIVGTRPYEQTLAVGQDAYDQLRRGHLPALFTEAVARDASARLAGDGRRYPGKGRGRRPVIRWRQGGA